jgi:Peptidyl-prolyl cis-trans isomerase (rotamase) - cyclophilin family
MPRLPGLFTVFLWVLGASVVNPAAATRAEAQALPHVVIQTELGNIEVEIDSIHAPITSANFLRYVDLGFYRFGRFYRTVRADNQADSKVKISWCRRGSTRCG